MFSFCERWGVISKLPRNGGECSYRERKIEKLRACSGVLVGVLSSEISRIEDHEVGNRDRLSPGRCSCFWVVDVGLGERHPRSGCCVNRRISRYGSREFKSCGRWATRERPG